MSAGISTNQADTPTATSDASLQVVQTDVVKSGDSAQTGQQVNSNDNSSLMTGSQNLTPTSDNSNAEDANQGNIPATNSQPATANNDVNKNTTTDPKTDTLGQVNFYYYITKHINYDGVVKKNAVYSIPFTKNDNVN